MGKDLTRLDRVTEFTIRDFKNSVRGLIEEDDPYLLEVIKEIRLLTRILYLMCPYCTDGNSSYLSDLAHRFADGKRTYNHFGIDIPDKAWYSNGRATIPCPVLHLRKRIIELRANLNRYAVFHYEQQMRHHE